MMSEWKEVKAGFETQQKVEAELNVRIIANLDKIKLSDE
jgi:hypothetical protein